LSQITRLTDGQTDRQTEFSSLDRAVVSTTTGMPITARLSLLDKNIGASAKFYAYITDKSQSHTKKYYVFS